MERVEKKLKAPQSSTEETYTARAGQRHFNVGNIIVKYDLKAYSP